MPKTPHIPTKLLALTALLPVLALAGPAAQAAEAPPTPNVEAVSLETAGVVSDKTIAVYFRTDRRIPRKQSNGKSLDAHALVLQTGSASISTLRGGTSCYVAYMPRLRTKVGSRYAVEIHVGSKTVLAKKLVLRKGTKASSRGSNVGCPGLGSRHFRR
jgi:hypothetical protein